MTAPSLKAATTTQIECGLSFVRCSDVTARPYPTTQTVLPRGRYRQRPRAILVPSSMKRWLLKEPLGSGNGRAGERHPHRPARANSQNPTASKPVGPADPPNRERPSQRQPPEASGLQSTHRIASNRLSGRPIRFANPLVGRASAPNKRRIWNSIKANGTNFQG
jgi:hypothetical protein